MGEITARFPSSTILPPTSAKSNTGMRESIEQIAHTMRRRMWRCTALEVVFLLDLLAPAAPSKLSRLPSDLKLMVCYHK